VLAASRITFPEAVLLTVRGSRKAADKDKRLKMVGAMEEIDRDDIKGRRACDGFSLSFKLD
jgi:hypothetical protein